MKLATYMHNGTACVGRVSDDEATVSAYAVEPAQAATDGVNALIGADLGAVGDAVPLSDVTLLAPVPRPARNVFCVGKNYHEHAHEFASSGFDSSAAQGAVPKAPIIFSKVPESVIAPDAAVKIDPDRQAAVDYEVELAVIIGKEGRDITLDQAMDHVWGYTIINDVTERDLQGRHSQWLIGKSQDTFCPMGPWVVTKDEIDLADTSVKCWINDELRQDSNTGLLIFDVPTIIAALSNGITLMPGDVIATGTPAGVGIGFKPPRYLAPGDHMRLEIAGIGTLSNPVEAR